MCYCEGVSVLDELAEDILFSAGLSRETRVNLLVDVITQLIGYGWRREKCKRDTLFAGDPLVEEAYTKAKEKLL